VKKKTRYFTRIFEDMMRTEAWQDLSGTEAKLYLEMVRKYRGNNNGAIVFGRREAEHRLRIGSHRAHDAFVGLERRGFIAPVVKGSFNRKLKATEWRLTEYDCDVTGEVATMDYARWRPENAEKSAGKIKTQVSKQHLAGVKTTPMQVSKRHHPAENPSNCNQGLEDPHRCQNDTTI
jgi:hypothetical protein